MPARYCLREGLFDEAGVGAVAAGGAAAVADIGPGLGRVCDRLETDRPLLRSFAAAFLGAGTEEPFVPH